VCLHVIRFVLILCPLVLKFQLFRKAESLHRRTVVLVPSTIEVVQPIDESDDFPIIDFTHIFETRRLENPRHAFVLKRGETPCVIPCT
jgi:hypothetical protein